MVKKTVGLLLLLFSIFLIYRNWFIFPFLSSPDFPYFFPETLADYRLFPPVWAPTLGIGLGGEMINAALGSFIYFIVMVFVNILRFPWEIVYKVFIFGLFLALSVFSSVSLCGSIFKRPSALQYLLSVLMFTANTYIFMIVDGGQVGVMLSYALVPLVLVRFIKFIDFLDERHPRRIRQALIFHSLLFGVVVALVVMFDLRIAFLSVGIGLFYALYRYIFIQRYSLFSIAGWLFVAAVVVIGLHAHWILPIVINQTYPGKEMLQNFGSLEGFRFFSFATFPQALSLLQPNWPENIFGKVYFMRPEFLVLPILAFASLLCIGQRTGNSKQHISITSISFFSFLGLVGAFLAKGANPPFSQINTWMFAHMPFSSLFRDSTKFYLLTALSYSILVPFSVNALAEWIGGRMKNKTVKLVILCLAILYIFFLIRPIFQSGLSGTFVRREIPKEYVDLKDFLHRQPDFFRTLWIPKQHRYNYYSYLHPAISAGRLFSATNSAEIINRLSEKKTEETLSHLSIRYVIVPFDSFGEIFVTDRKYDEGQYKDVISVLDSLPEFERLTGFGKIAVYKTSMAKDHFWLDGAGSLTYDPIGPSEYTVKLSADEPATVIFTDAYSPYWKAKIQDKLLQSQRTTDGLNSFTIEKAGTYVVTVFFSKQQSVIYGRIITVGFISLLLFASICRIIQGIYDKYRRRKN